MVPRVNIVSETKLPYIIKVIKPLSLQLPFPSRWQTHDKTSNLSHDWLIIRQSPLSFGHICLTEGAHQRVTLFAPNNVDILLPFKTLIFKLIRRTLVLEVGRSLFATQPNFCLSICSVRKQ
jgi:hypothetical protein